MHQRGEVHLLEGFQFPNRRGGGEHRKYVVALQDERRFPTDHDVAVLVCSTQRLPEVRDFEVQVGVEEGFEQDTIIDCRWIYTIPKYELTLDTRQFTLSPEVMESVAEAIFIGLQLA